MALQSDWIDRITDKIIEILEADETLADGLTGPVQVYKGMRRQGPEAHAVYVFRATMDSYGYWMGTTGTDIEGTWAIVCMSRYLGSAAELERLVATLTANVTRCMLGHKQEAGYWTTAELESSDAMQIRDDRNQSYETEMIKLAVSWSTTEA